MQFCSKMFPIAGNVLWSGMHICPCIPFSYICLWFKLLSIISAALFSRKFYGFIVCRSSKSNLTIFDILNYLLSANEYNEKSFTSIIIPIEMILSSIVWCSAIFKAQYFDKHWTSEAPQSSPACFCVKRTLFIQYRSHMCHTNIPIIMYITM